jgi:hypothetical protein
MLLNISNLMLYLKSDYKYFSWDLNQNINTRVKGYSDVYFLINRKYDFKESKLFIYNNEDKELPGFYVWSKLAGCTNVDVTDFSNSNKYVSKSIPCFLVMPDSLISKKDSLLLKTCNTFCSKTIGSIDDPGISEKKYKIFEFEIKK